MRERIYQESCPLNGPSGCRFTSYSGLVLHIHQLTFLAKINLFCQPIQNMLSIDQLMRMINLWNSSLMLTFPIRSCQSRNSVILLIVDFGSFGVVRSAPSPQVTLSPPTLPALPRPPLPLYFGSWMNHYSSNNDFNELTWKHSLQ